MTDDAGVNEHLFDAAIALGLGLMIGLEREHHETREDATPEPVLLGVRTLALVALLGWASGLLGQVTGSPWLPAAVLVAIAGLCAATFLTHREAATGLTSEVAALVTAVIGMLVHHERMLAVALAVAVTLLLFSKPWFAELMPRLRRVDLAASLQIALLLAIVLPLLPEEASDPWGALPPRKIGLFVALIMGVDYLGYVAHRVLGRQRGAGVIGIVGGLGSSTALTAAMARQARGADDATVAASQMATFLANAVMATRIGVIAAVLSRSLALAVAPALGAALVVFLTGAVWKWRAAREVKGRANDGIELRNPLSLLAALKWGVFLSFVLVAAAVMKDVLGDRGLLAAAAVSGLADVDAITLAVSRQWAGGEVTRQIAVLAIMIAAGTNTLVKGGIALVTGRWAFGRDVALVFAGALTAGIVVALAL
jgi:uncharacterized membrane protein (DUF4010 family)